MGLKNTPEERILANARFYKLVAELIRLYGRDFTVGLLSQVSERIDSDEVLRAAAEAARA